MNYKKHNLVPVKDIKKPKDFSNAWDNFVKKQPVLPSRVKEKYYNELLAIATKMDVKTFFRHHKDAKYKFPIDQKKIDNIEQIVNDNVNAWLYKEMGLDLEKKYIKKLRKKGIIGRFIKRNHFTKDSFIFGRVMHLLERAVDFYDALRMAKRAPLSDMELAAIDLLKTRSCDAVKGMANKYAGKIKDVLVEKNHQFLRDMMAEGKSKKMTKQEVKSAIGHATKDWNRDLYRITYTEMNTSEQYAIALDLHKKFGTNPLTGKPMRIKVAKMPEPDACKYCLQLYTFPDGSLRWFYLDELLAGPLMNTPYPDPVTGVEVKRYASKIGDKERGWIAVIGSTHPYCRCNLVKYYEHLHDRKTIEDEIKNGITTKVSLKALDGLQKDYEEQWFKKGKKDYKKSFTLTIRL